MSRDKSFDDEAFGALVDLIGVDLIEANPVNLLVEQCRSLLDVAAAGLVVVATAGALRTVAAAGDPALLGALFDSSIDDGPCHESYTSRAPVIEADLAAHPGRWPEFGPIAWQVGVGAAHAFPLQVAHRTVGALGLFATRPAALSEFETQLGQSLADHAAISLVSYASARKAWSLASQLQTALTSRVVIEQAKGMLAQRGGTSVHLAFEALRHFSRTNRIKLTDVAHDLVDGKLDLDRVLEHYRVNGSRPAGHRSAHQWHASRRRRSRIARQGPTAAAE